MGLYVCARVHRDPERRVCAHTRTRYARRARPWTIVMPGKGPEAHAIPILIFHPET